MIEVEIYSDEKFLVEERIVEGEEELFQDAWVEIAEALMMAVVEGNALTFVVLVKMPVSQEIMLVAELLELLSTGLTVFLHTDPKREHHKKP